MNIFVYSAMFQNLLRQPPAGLFSFYLEVKIRCLKEEAKDDDLDSGVSNALKLWKKA